MFVDVLNIKKTLTLNKHVKAYSKSIKRTKIKLLYIHIRIIAYIREKNCFINICYYFFLLF